MGQISAKCGVVCERGNNISWYYAVVNVNIDLNGSALSRILILSWMSRNLLWKLIYDFVCKLTAANSWLSAEPKVHQTVRFMILVMLERQMTTNKFLPVVKIM